MNLFLRAPEFLYEQHARNEDIAIEFEMMFERPEFEKTPFPTKFRTALRSCCYNGVWWN